MKISEILSNVDVLELSGCSEISIKGITNDSRNIKDGFMFVAIKGFQTDGNEYIKKAFENGAVVVLCQEKPSEDVPYILVKDSRFTMSKVAVNFYKNPTKDMKITGITGTNGKTTVTYLVKHILESFEEKMGLIGTNQNMICDQIIETERTTPESNELQEIFLDMKNKKCSGAVMEVSSHSLVLNRVDGIEFDTCAFTNISQDHLDFHNTIEEYAKAKSLLFSKCKTGIINLDDEFANVMQKDATCDIITYGINNEKADLNATNTELLSDKVLFDVTYKQKTIKATLYIPGKFSIYNALTAIGVCVSYGYDLEDVIKYLETASGVKGRVEVVRTKADFTVLIDYAHSPDGILNVLSAVKGFAKGRVIGLFGCGGDRDRTKRPLMAQATVKYADITIVTSDNPRTENPSEIIKDIVSGIESYDYKMIEDRREAISYALSIAKKDDVIVLMGKGHETYQEINGVKHHLDEREEVQKYFA